MDTLTDHQVRDALRPYQDGGTLSALFETGEITEDTIPALGLAMQSRDQLNEHQETDTLGDVLAYVDAVGERQPVPNWPNR
ncbi:hypothetical protein ACGFRG_25635 [Streptomyces sp. NPDC048696]|uniref:hypothetical protein n=1 Tax=Streptomyces sp. NPDC048696 TaxID=3365585 RepID=UPI0037164843